MTVPADELRIFVYDLVVQHGLPPTSAQIGERFGVQQAAARDAIASLKIGKTVLAHPRTGEIWMAGPFSAAPTSYRAVGRKTEWFANCAWDMLGVAVLARERVEVHTRCTDCHELMVIDVDPDRGPNLDAVVHFLVPAGKWYDDIGFT